MQRISTVLNTPQQQPLRIAYNLHLPNFSVDRVAIGSGYGLRNPFCKLVVKLQSSGLSSALDLKDSVLPIIYPL